ncbi:cyanophycin synthetase [Alicyclobacillus hesperidum]|uniref:Cyanophycin synthetase n=1 Tax=Alicyclobacillus hesperidum TaxID=89784 RepID=A0AA37TXD7_9BACL|nr:cyanophycin synthetase [Alicyclobacillus hesperidum]GLV13915.1 cyanophycin synthetase [Alicyclobacillus hesperidum]
MNIQSVRHIEGPNVYLYKPILVARIHLGEWTEKESVDYPGFTERLLALLPGLAEHHCAKGAPGGFVERLQGGTYFGHICEHVAIELANLAGLGVNYGKTVYADGPGIYDIVLECACFETQRWLLLQAVELVRALSRDERAPDVAQIITEARDIHAQYQLGPSTQAIVDACKRRGIPVRRLQGSFLELGYGVHRKRVEATITQKTSCVGVDIASDKAFTKRLLEDVGIPVPYGGVATSPEEAIDWLCDVGAPVVVKPLDGRQGQGVSLNLTTEDEVRKAFAVASEYSRSAVVEEYIPGSNVRLLVVAGRCVAASLRQPAMVEGDGKATIRELIERVNQDPRRGVGHEKPLTRIAIDAVVERVLAKAGYTLESVPAQGERVTVRDSANLSTGGEACDVTDVIHPTYRRIAEQSAMHIGLDVCGVDMVIRSLHEPAARGNCAVIEVNAAPGIRMHEHPSQGEPRRVAEAIVESLFPNGQNGRIPIISITGTNGKTTTSRLVAHGFATAGKTVGHTSTGGVYIGGTLVQPGDTTGPRSARLVLSHPEVEVAVLETARGGIIRGGLAYDYADVGVITNISLDHVGQDCLDSIDDIAHVKALVGERVRPGGIVVLNADDDRVMAMRSRFQAEAFLTSLSQRNERIVRHIAAGGTAFYVEDGQIVEANGRVRRTVVPVAEIPITLGGTVGFHVENALLATAAMRAAGLPRRLVAKALRTFEPDRNQGRCAMFQLQNGAHVILDYAHNPAGFQRVGEWLERVPHKRLLGVVGVPGDRADHVVEQAAQALAPWFDQFIVKEDQDLRGRKPGEIARIMQTAIAQAVPHKPVKVVLSEVQAMEAALCDMQAGDVLCVFYEKLAPLEQRLTQLGAVRVHGLPVQSDGPSYAML